MPRASAAATTTEETLQARAFGEIQHLLMRALDRPAFRRRSGFARMHQSFLAAPGCFLWSERRRGVHALEVTDARRGNDLLGLGPYLWFRLGIRYYPHPEEPIFEEYSMAERLLRLGPVFGEHGVPSPASSRQLRPGFFVVGFIECAAQDGGVDVAFAVGPGPLGRDARGRPHDREIPRRHDAGASPRWPGPQCAGLGPRLARLPTAGVCLLPGIAGTASVCHDGDTIRLDNRDQVRRAVEETPASDTLERRYDACLLPSAGAAIARRLDWAMEQLVSGSDGAASQPENRSWHATRLPITRGRTTLPPIPKSVVR
jgi:hypothetical protein